MQTYLALSASVLPIVNADLTAMEDMYNQVRQLQVEGEVVGNDTSLNYDTSDDYAGFLTEFGFDYMATTDSPAGTASTNGPGGNGKALNSVQLFHVREIIGYGCWCQFGYDKLYTSFGNPKDQIDTLCMVLNEGRQCTRQITEEEGEIFCDPTEQNYNVDMADIFGYPDWEERIVEQCALLDDPCKERACNLETKFVIEFSQIKNTIDDDLKHRNGFEVSTETCEVRESRLTKTEYKCCGQFPKMRRVAAFGPNWQCCGNKCFDPEIDNCCGDNLLGFHIC